MFPPENQISPVADQLRQMLATAPWARVGLGLPVVGSLMFVITFCFGLLPLMYQKVSNICLIFHQFCLWLWLARYLPPAHPLPQLLKVSCQNMKLILVSVINNCIVQFKEISSFLKDQCSHLNKLFFACHKVLGWEQQEPLKGLQWSNTDSEAPSKPPFESFAGA